MHKTVDIDENRFNSLEKNPVLFLKFHEHTWYDNNGHEHDASTWRAVDKDLNISFDAGNFGNRRDGYCLIIIDGAKPKIGDNDSNVVADKLEMSFHDASERDIKDWVKIINSYILRSRDTEDKFAYMDLLWFLDKKFLNIDLLKEVLGQYNQQTIPYIVKVINLVGHCLSIKKQRCLQKVCEAFNARYNIYAPPILIDAYKTAFPQNDDIENLNLYQIVDKVLSMDSEPVDFNLKDNTGNLLALYQWLHSSDSFGNYSLLKRLFVFVSEDTKLEIVKRYFHDLRLGNTVLDMSLLEQFKDNRFSDFIRFRYCIESPSEAVVLTVPLLCDNIITLYNSKGSTFQTFDGVLDFAITHCDKAHPGVAFGLERFLPCCQNSAVFNAEHFKGFIDYAIVRKLDDTALSEDKLKAEIISILNTYGCKATYSACKFGDGDELSPETNAKCFEIRKDGKGKTYHLECVVKREYHDKWLVSNQILPILKDAIISPSAVLNPIANSTLVTLDMTSTERLRSYILELPTKYENHDNGEFVIPSYSTRSKSLDLVLIENFSKPLRMRIFPQEGALIGVDVFGLWKNIKPVHSEDLQNREQIMKACQAEYDRQESEEVKKRTTNSLKKELGVEISSEGYFELPFDRETLINVIRRFYFKASFAEKDERAKREFLTVTSPQSLYPQYCAPQKSQANNPALNLPYFWCRGKECFRNNLGDQTLSECNDWHKYTLYHMVEIIGYPKLHKTEAGNEPDAVVWQFIAITNKVMQKFRRLKCRTCGHMMFTERASGYNRYNYYACINPVCTELNKAVYLNFCFKCKKGLIDSRDTKQCPNGWYICPTCLACCDDAQYDRLAQRYVVSNRPVPERIRIKLGCGHNDKDMFFCPDCGNPVEQVTDEHGRTFKGCPKCHKNLGYTGMNDYEY